MLASDLKTFQDASRRQGVILSFGGDLSENLLHALGEVLKLRMRQGTTDANVAKRVFSIFVEQAQNVIRYSADRLSPADAPLDGRVSAGMIVVGVEGERFFVACGNEVPQAEVAGLRSRLDHLAGLSGEELRLFYREKLRQPAEETSLGGSLGLIEIARRASEPVAYGFEDVGGGRSFFCLKAFI
ncbi:SiaB family protein kinase [Methylobacterium oryzihabitans]|uniref:Histidine kinase n=1 Tax=Methylobacterium oryzihabitans TaxID=2499852 RepID=A0A3S2V0B1_9HYPH|nr:SiaB family protein kinase [Methylobacterium oryzihabitans]RVU12002.1 hypothetical protein EOE48_28025 [Methylobacterium oryzihabitans]